MSSPIDVGCEKQLFIDDWLIESIEGVVLTVNPPRKTGERLIVADKPWEAQGIGGYKTVIDDDGIYRIWYMVHESVLNNLLLCYAYSVDGGTHWVKPDLGIMEYLGSKANNIVYAPLEHPYGRCHGPTVFKDPTQPDDSQRKYKMLYWMDRHKKYKRCRIHGVLSKRPVGMGVAFSPDGLHWKPSEKNPVMENFGDTQNVAFWDDRIGKYVAYTRM